MEGFGPPGGDVADHDLVVAAREQGTPHTQYYIKDHMQNIPVSSIVERHGPRDHATTYHLVCFVERDIQVVMHIG